MDFLNCPVTGYEHRRQGRSAYCACGMNVFDVEKVDLTELRQEQDPLYFEADFEERYYDQ